MFISEIALEQGIEIPEPVKEDYSGKFNVRVPKSLHKYLSELAKKENISLNQLILIIFRGVPDLKADKLERFNTRSLYFTQ